MEKAARYHRDIYSGMVASELAKEGYFGDEYRLYGFLCWIGNEKKFITAEKEEECARIYVDAVEQGALVTPSFGGRQGGRYGRAAGQGELLLFTGGVAKNEGVKEFLSRELGRETVVAPASQLAGTLGAAPLVREKPVRKKK